MKVSDIFNILHNAVEAKQFGKKISQRAMADRLGVSMRTYQDWRIGKAGPVAARALMQMLGELEDDEIIRVVRKLNATKADDE